MFHKQCVLSCSGSSVMLRVFLQEAKNDKQSFTFSKAVQSSVNKQYGSLAGMLVHHLLKAMSLGGSSGLSHPPHHIYSFCAAFAPLPSFAATGPLSSLLTFLRVFLGHFCGAFPDPCHALSTLFLLASVRFKRFVCNCCLLTWWEW